jgi:heme A synthase
MATLHAIGALAVFVTIVLAILAAAGAALRGGAGWVDRLRTGVLAVVALQAAIGAVTYLGGSRPAEPLHLVYGLAAIAVLPLAGTFAAEAPPRPRAWVLVVALATLLLLTWRLASTG